MSARRELTAFALVLGAAVGAVFGESLFGGKVLSPADVLFVSATFREGHGADYEPSNRLLIDAVLQFQPWLEFNRAMFRRGRLPLWNDLAGCGAPHLANGQSAPFDPFHLIAYLGPLPGALAWMASARLWVSGLGMFVLARSWGFGAWGRWFAGLTFPFCGFLVVWLMFPVTAVAVWMPWLFWATDRALDRPGPRPVGLLGVVVGCIFLGGHVQTSAQVLLAAGAYAAWRLARAEGRALRPAASWGAGVALGLMVAAVSIVPLGAYLGKSPVWGDRERERPSTWALTRPRALDAVCTAIPYAFGSQRRGHPNLARALGVHNVNESAGGFAGLATLIWLAPQGWRARRAVPRAGFLAGLAAFGALGAFESPPVINGLRALPVLNVTDHRRLTLWVAFALVLLGGAGLDHLAARWPRRLSLWWVSLWVAGAAVLWAAAVTVSRSEPWLRGRARDHYARAAEPRGEADPDLYRRRADRQVRQALDVLPRVYALAGLELAMLAGLAVATSRGSLPVPAARALLFGATLAELFGFGYGLNPAIDRRDDRPLPAVIARLQHEVGRSGRVLGVGEELPPNVAMRYGLADVRNYDSVELSRSLDWFEPLYEPVGGARSSRRPVAWSGVLRARERLREACVAAVVGASPPPNGLSDRVERLGPVWVARLDPAPPVSGGEVTGVKIDNGAIQFMINFSGNGRAVVRQTYDPGWRAEVDGAAAPVEAYRGAFLSVRAGAGRHRVRLAYDPPEARAACAASLAAVAAAGLALAGFPTAGSRRFLGQRLGRP